MRLIHEGDKVEIAYSTRVAFTGIVTHTPSDTGDMWFIRSDIGEDVAINPQCSLLIYIKKIEEAPDVPNP